jgi:hypothetical protein
VLFFSSSFFRAILLFLILHNLVAKNIFAAAVSLLEDSVAVV